MLPTKSKSPKASSSAAARMEGDPIITKKAAANTAEGGAEEVDSFYTLYNKEIKVNQN